MPENDQFDLPSYFKPGEGEDPEINEGDVIIFPPLMWFAYDTFSQRGVFHFPLNLNEGESMDRYGGLMTFLSTCANFFGGPPWAHVYGNIPVAKTMRESAVKAAYQASGLLPILNVVMEVISTTIYYEALRESAGEQYADKYANSVSLADMQQKLGPMLNEIGNAVGKEPFNFLKLLRFCGQEPLEGEVLYQDDIRDSDGAEELSELPFELEDDPDATEWPADKERPDDSGDGSW